MNAQNRSAAQVRRDKSDQEIETAARAEANRGWRFHPLRLAAQAALDAYEHRFGSTRPIGERTREEVNLTGPIDDEMKALRDALSASWGT